MKTFTTLLRAIDPEDGELKTWMGPKVVAPDWETAEEYCRSFLGYCQVNGEYLDEIHVSEAELVRFQISLADPNLN